MPQDRDHLPSAASTPAPAAADFDEAFSAAASPGIRRVWELAAPDLPPQIEPFGRRLVLTSWQPKVPGDARVPARMRTGWPQALRSAGFAGIEMQTRPEWHDLWTRVYRVALDLSDPGSDTLLADLQDEARHRLPLADLIHRVAVTATRS